MTLVALKDLPHGIRAGQAFEINAIVGRILIGAGAARATRDQSSDDSPSEKPQRAKRTYKRRDLKAED